MIALANSFVWGQNHDTGEGKTQSFLIESNYQRGRDTVYAPGNAWRNPVTSWFSITG